MPDDLVAEAVDPSPPVTPPPPTQTVYPWRATLRTVVQVGTSAVLVLGLLVPQIVDIILDEASGIPGRLRAVLLGMAGVVTALAAIVTRIMALPTVEAWLQRGRARSTLAAKPRTPQV